MSRTARRSGMVSTSIERALGEEVLALPLQNSLCLGQNR
jgi:hypothetical protein